MNIEKLIYKTYNYETINNLVNGNITFINHNNKHYILFLSNINYEIIEIPYNLIKILKIILRYKKNKNSNVLKILKYNYKKLLFYNYNLRKILIKNDICNDIYVNIKSYLIDHELFYLMMSIKYNKYRTILYQCLGNLQLYEDIQKIQELNYNHKIICIFPDHNLKNFVNIIRKNKQEYDNFYNALTKIKNEYL